VHLKQVVVIVDDVHTRAWVETAIGALDVTIHYFPTSDLVTCLAGDLGDLFIVDARRDAAEVVGHADAASASGWEGTLLLVVEQHALERLRMPVRFPADFAMRDATPAETAARVRALLWPGEETAADDLIRIGDLTLDLASYQAQVAGAPVEFTYLEYTLFAYLVTHPNRVYSREVLLSRVWGTDYYGGARTVDVHVRRIRAKLGPEAARHLETVRNVGYLWRR
jgi:DNA-binding response OmpR family regulator